MCSLPKNVQSLEYVLRDFYFLCNVLKPHIFFLFICFFLNPHLPAHLEKAWFRSLESNSTAWGSPWGQSVLWLWQALFRSGSSSGPCYQCSLQNLSDGAWNGPSLTLSSGDPLEGPLSPHQQQNTRSPINMTQTQGCPGCILGWPTGSRCISLGAVLLVLIQRVISS